MTKFPSRAYTFDKIEDAQAEVAWNIQHPGEDFPTGTFEYEADGKPEEPVNEVKVTPPKELPHHVVLFIGIRKWDVMFKSERDAYDFRTCLKTGTVDGMLM